jgi:hypothetical protein
MHGKVGREGREGGVKSVFLGMSATALLSGGRQRRFVNSVKLVRKNAFSKQLLFERNPVRKCLTYIFTLINFEYFSLKQLEKRWVYLL